MLGMLRWLIVVWLVSAPTAFAQDVDGSNAAASDAEDPDAESADQQAQRHFAVAQSLYTERNYESALREFEEAYALAPRPRLLYNISLCHERLGSYAAAAEHLSRYLEASQDVPDREVLERRLVNLRERARPARIEVETDPADGSVLVDGEWIGRGSVHHELTPGRHHLRVRADGYESHERHFELEPAEVLAVRVELDAVRSVWRSPVLWTIVGVVIVGAGVGLGVGLSRRPEEYGGTANRIFVVGR